ncbi:MAG TPA: beta-propeller domain-containing protein [Phycisphaerae bacterium]|nr:beta-propeller domain-containing protein [Phycisphaerae bacterium]
MLRASHYLKVSILALTLLPFAGCGTQSTGGTANDAAGGTGQFAAAPTVATDSAQTVAREVEEADIIKIDSGKLFALNRYKGLLIIDVSNPDTPTLLGTLDLKGRGVEMYVIGTRVYVILSADYAYAVDNNVGVAESGGAGAPGAPATILPGPTVPPPDFTGSQVGIVDITNPAAPTLLNSINLVGYANDSRRVGNIIYIVGANGFPYYFRTAGDTQTDEGFVASIDVTDPNNVIPVERKTFSGTSLAVHVSDSLIMAASQNFDQNSGDTTTHVQAIDITDPAGAIALRGTIDVPGAISNRFFMDDDSGVFRIVTGSTGFGYIQVKLFTYDLTDLDHITQLGSVDIKQGEQAQAVRFDGDRGYVVTFQQVDPLFVLDIHDAAHPTVTGSLEVPGFSTQLEPRGNRLIAIGIDNTNGSRPAVSYYNVQDPVNPTQIGRVVLGPPGGYTDSTATYDEKAYKIIDDFGLIVVPFHHVDYSQPVPVPLEGGAGGSSGGSSGSDGTTTSDTAGTAPTCVSGVQLVDFNDTALTQRGWFAHTGTVERVGALAPRVFALSEEALQTVDITDRDNPKKVGDLHFFTADEEAQFNDCGYYFYEVPPTGTGDLFTQILNRFCGQTSVMPTAGIGLLLCFMKLRVRRVGSRDSQSNKRC